MTASLPWLAVLAFGVVSAARAESPSRVSIHPMTVTAPAGAGWTVVRRDYDVTYQRIDPAARQQRTAYASVIQFKAADNAAAIEAELKSNLAQQISGMPSLGKVVYTTSHARGYPCVRASAEATQTVSVPNQNRPIVVPVTMVYFTCRNLGTAPVGFFAGYSYGAFERSTSVEKEADAFFDGIRLDRF